MESENVFWDVDRLVKLIGSERLNDGRPGSSRPRLSMAGLASAAVVAAA